VLRPFFHGVWEAVLAAPRIADDLGELKLLARGEVLDRIMTLTATEQAYGARLTAQAGPRSEDERSASCLLTGLLTPVLYAHDGIRSPWTGPGEATRNDARRPAPSRSCVGCEPAGDVCHRG
jgi:hypothetical protein